jgi:hypothetical protein
MERAWGLLTEMEKAGLKPDNFTYSTLIKGIKPAYNNPRQVSYGQQSNQNVKSATRGGAGSAGKF